MFHVLTTWLNLLLSFSVTRCPTNNPGSPATPAPCHLFNFLDLWSLFRLFPLPGLPFLHTVSLEDASDPLSNISVPARDPAILSINKAGLDREAASSASGGGGSPAPSRWTDTRLGTLSFVRVRERDDQCVSCRDHQGAEKSKHQSAEAVLLGAVSGAKEVALDLFCRGEFWAHNLRGTLRKQSLFSGVHSEIGGAGDDVLR